ncbi:MAG: hypothetical protein AAF824_22945 [Bacteroidota bacterium]
MARHKPTMEVFLRQKYSPWLISIPFALGLAVLLVIEIMDSEEVTYQVEKAPLPAEVWLAYPDLVEAEIISFLRNELYILRQLPSPSENEQSTFEKYTKALPLYETIEDHRTRIAFEGEGAVHMRDSLEDDIQRLIQQLMEEDLLIEL